QPFLLCITPIHIWRMQMKLDGKTALRYAGKFFKAASEPTQQTAGLLRTYCFLVLRFRLQRLLNVALKHEELGLDEGSEIYKRLENEAVALVLDYVQKFSAQPADI